MECKGRIRRLLPVSKAKAAESQIFDCGTRSHGVSESFNYNPPWILCAGNDYYCTDDFDCMTECEFFEGRSSFSRKALLNLVSPIDYAYSPER